MLGFTPSGDVSIGRLVLAEAKNKNLQLKL